MKKCTIFVCLDAFRHDLLKERHAPFLFNLAQEGVHGKIETLLGFLGIYITPFSGVYPDTHGVWTLFYYDPISSPFKWISSLSPFLSTFESVPDIKRSLRLGIAGVNNLVRYFQGHKRLEMIYDVPLKYLKYFNLSMDKAVCQKKSLGQIQTVFDVLRKEGVSFLFWDWPLICTERGVKLDLGKYSDNRLNEIVKKYSKKNYGLYYFHVWDLDKVTHTYGSRSKQVIDRVRALDNGLEEVIGEFQKRHSQVDIIMFSDHGMIDVERKLNVMEAMENSGLKEEEDYLTFLDSTMARFWFKNKRARDKTEEVLLRLNGGHILTKEERKRFRIDFPHTRYGELTFLADPSFLLSPNYFQGWEEVKAMHGYDPLHPDLYGIFIAHIQGHLTGTRLENAKLVDISSTLLDAMGFPWPSTFEGRSLLKL